MLAGLPSLGIRCSIVLNIVLAHQSDLFRGGYKRAGSIMPDVNVGAKKHEKDCNADSRIHHEGLLAYETGFGQN